MSVTSRQSANALVPFGYTTTWGDRTRPKLCDRWCGPKDENLRFKVCEPGPVAPGKYFLVVAHAGMYTIEQVFSNTHPGLTREGCWYDGNDKGWDWVPSDFEQTSMYGNLTEVMRGASGPLPPWFVPADWLGVQVVP